MSEVVEAKGPRRVTVKDRHQILIELIKCPQRLVMIVFFTAETSRLHLHISVELRESVVQVKVA